MITQPLFIKVQTKLSTLNTILQENLAGIKVVKAFATEPRERKRFRPLRRRLDAPADHRCSASSAFSSRSSS